LSFDANGVAQAFEEAFVTPLRMLACQTIDVPAIIRGTFTLRVANEIAAAYRRHLFGNATLQDLPDRPRFVINATNVQSGALWRFSKPYMWDYRVGKIERPTLDLSSAVAASSAFPPFLSPLVLNFRPTDFVPNTGIDLQRPPFTTRVLLTDGGVYDNLGLETAWKSFQTVLVSDGGGKMKEEARPSRLWPKHVLRVLSMMDNQVRSLRYRSLIEGYKTKLRSGAYWGIRTDIADFRLADALVCPFDRTARLASVPTRLAATPDQIQERLINWGYAVCDAGMRAYVDPSLPAPSGFPYPASGV
jgi:NTE family protein